MVARQADKAVIRRTESKNSVRIPPNAVRSGSEQAYFTSTTMYLLKRQKAAGSLISK